MGKKKSHKAAMALEDPRVQQIESIYLSMPELLIPVQLFIWIG